MLKLLKFGKLISLNIKTEREIKEIKKSFRAIKRRYILQRELLYWYFSINKFHCSEFRIWHTKSKINKGECVILHHLSSDIYLEVDTIYFDKQGFIKI